jgi:hypothetical protein
LKPRDIAFLLLATCAAVLVHGYHPGVEDAEIYLPGIKHHLNPALYPGLGREFWASHAGMTLFDEIIAWSIKLTHVPVDCGLFAWHLISIFLLLLGCWRLGRLCFPDSRARWGAVTLVAALLTLPVAGTALYIMDQYVTTRALSAPFVLLGVVSALERKYGRATLWLAITAAMHPLMAVFGIAFVMLFVFANRGAVWQSRARAAGTAALLFPMVLRLGPASDAYREALNSRSYFFILRWQWYEWLGIFGPLALLWWLARLGKTSRLRNLQAVSRALLLFGLTFFALALALTIPPQFENLAELQPMRSLHLLYVMLFALLGGAIAQWVLKDRAWRWLALFLPLCAGMWYAQRQIFPATPHIELPQVRPGNLWAQAFDWIRRNTPQDAVFALDPQHMRVPGEDQHGFRALAERSRLADQVKDSGVVSMFPGAAETWREQVRALGGWRNFQAADFYRLRRQYGVSWVILRQPGGAGLVCPYQNAAVLVCKVE